MQKREEQPKKSDRKEQVAVILFIVMLGVCSFLSIACGIVYTCLDVILGGVIAFAAGGIECVAFILYLRGYISSKKSEGEDR